MARAGDEADGTGTAEPVRSDMKIPRALFPSLAVVIVLLAVSTEPGGWLGVVLLLPLATFVVWYRWGLSDVLLTVGVVVPVVLVQHDGSLEPAMFLVSLLALAVTGWRHQYHPTVVALVLVMVASPLAVALVQGGADIAWPIWIMGIAFPACMGWMFGRQATLAAQLERSRRELAEQEGREERRRIARDVHDLVGHGLAAMMLQVTSARHVLRRDPDSAEEALEAAERVGRRNMQELRYTVAALRDSADGSATPLPGLRQIADLVASTRAGGLDVRHREVGLGRYDDEGVDQAIEVTLYRITQESLANAVRHAPRASTVVTTTVGDDTVTVEVTTSGPTAPTPRQDTTRPRYGLRGMRERADVVGGQLTAGPTPNGWLVRCTVPLIDRDRSP